MFGKSVVKNKDMFFIGACYPLYNRYCIYGVAHKRRNLHRNRLALAG